MVKSYAANADRHCSIPIPISISLPESITLCSEAREFNAAALCFKLSKIKRNTVATVD